MWVRGTGEVALRWGGGETVEIVRGAILNYPPGGSTTERVASL